MNRKKKLLTSSHRAECGGEEQRRREEEERENEEECEKLQSLRQYIWRGRGRKVPIVQGKGVNY